MAALIAVLAVPALSGAKNSNTYIDPFAPGSVCKHYKLSHKHAKHKRSPYGACVVAMKQLQRHRKLSAKKACKKLSHKHKRHHTSNYTRCVKAGKRLRA